MFSKLFGFGKKEESLSVSPRGDFSFLKTEFHNHLIPGIDDGSDSVEESLEMIRRFEALGYQNIITTPHVKIDHFPNSREIIQQGMKELQQVLQTENIRMNVRAAAEYFVDDHFMDLLETDDLMPITGNEVLIEFSFMSEPLQLRDIVFKIQTKGYKPILAHPERFEYFHRQPEIYSELKDRGCLLQLNLLSLSGYYGRGVKDIAERLLEQKLYHYCGSDAHHLRHTESLDKLRHSKVYDTLAAYPFRNAMIKM